MFPTSIKVMYQSPKLKNAGQYRGGNPNGQVGEWLKPIDCKSIASGYDGSNPSLSTSLQRGEVETR